MSYYISPRFLDKLAVHITKNFMDLPGVKVPLILGVHGRKGEGKSFQCELVFEKMGIIPVRMSAGELESPDAGDPVRLIRMRYREAAELIRVRGKMCVLLINDLDAGAGRVDRMTQYTVNTQLVNGTLMNIADNPTDVQLPGSYETEPIHRVPIIATGNDFSTLYAPLVRDGRMEKFYWQPSHEDRIGVVAGIFAPDGLSATDVERLVEAFPRQSLDFFGALRSQLYNNQVREFINKVGLGKVSTHLVNNPGQRLQFDKTKVGLTHLIEIGQYLQQEQTQLQDTRLAGEYFAGAESSKSGRSRNLQPQPSIPLTQPPEPTLIESNYVSNINGSTPQDGWPEKVAVAKIEQLLQRAILQGGRLTLEVARPREKSNNVWRTWPWPRLPENATHALEGIKACLKEHPNSFIRLIGYNPQTQTRLLEELIVRP
ncbi:MAG: AAA family ATPase [Cyanobacteria bacterium P01_A01_bin.17]